MKKYTLPSTFFFCILIQPVCAQSPDTLPPPNAVSSDSLFKSVRMQAQFPGGVPGWSAFLQATLKTNTPIKHHAPPGNYTVILSFLVLTDGSVTEVKADTDPGYGCAEEGVRVLKKSPKWKPATINGKPVNYRQKQSITFQVSE